MKKLISVLATILLLVTCGCSVLAAHPSRIVDMGDLLSSVEEQILEADLEEISERIDFDVVVVTTTTLDGKSVEDYADDYYDYNGYGMGTDADGAILLIDMGTRQWYISTSGFGITAITDARIEDIGEEMLPYLSAGAYYEAFQIYAEMCETYVVRTLEGDTDAGASVLTRLVVCVGIGMIIALVSVSVMKSKLKSVKFQNSARAYVVSSGLQLHKHSDRFLYVHRERERLPDESERSGSHVHRGSSGRSHGGGGGRF